MRNLVAIIVLLFVTGCGGNDRARNVILFIGDAGGIPTLHAASIHGHRNPQALYIQQMPHIGLSDTSAVDRWVTDSAAGMTAIVTGEKTKNGVISQSADAVRGKTDGTPLKTILEYAEERGLSTGVITNTSIADATPGATYAHANDRKKIGEIFAQLATPRFGDGPEVIVGGGRTAVLNGTRALGTDIEKALRDRGYTWLDAPSAITADATRVVALTDDPDFDLASVVERAINILSKNRRGYFLMVEWDMHTNRLERGLNHVLTLDSVIRKTADQVKDDTLIMFTADHSFDLRVRGGMKNEQLVPPDAIGEGGEDDAPAPVPAGAQAAPASTAKPNVRVENGHTGEQVLVAAKGPGSERVRGFVQNTDLFRIMLAAYGWER